MLTRALADTPPAAPSPLLLALQLAWIVRALKCELNRQKLIEEHRRNPLAALDRDPAVRAVLKRYWRPKVSVRPLVAICRPQTRTRAPRPARRLVRRATARSPGEPDLAHAVAGSPR